jgi:Zn-dependent peptidase ImmA (M78 family)
MRFFVEKISKLEIGWNERSLDAADLDLLCRRFGVTVQEIPLRTDGFYYRVMGRNFIAVNSRLGPVKKLTVLFHEFGHFLFHAPESGPAARFHGVGRHTRKEREADVFALCALMPTHWVTTRTIDDLLADGFSLEAIAERFDIFKKYAI